MILERPAYAPKWLLNGFPKSGLHLLVGYLEPVAAPLVEKETPFRKNWGGTFYDHSWSNRWAPLEQSLYKFGRLQDQHFLRAHVGYRDEVERFLYYLGAAHAFVYRDPRDVAVSQAHHILAGDDERFVHPAKDAYRALAEEAGGAPGVLEGEGFEAVLRAVIEGYGPFPGVMARWRLYAPWVGVDWVLQCRFEELIGDREGQAARILEYGLGRVAKVWERTVRVEPDAFGLLVGLMAENSRDTGRSATFRQGTAGGWRGCFTGELCDLFRRTDVEGAVEALGYEW